MQIREVRTYALRHELTPDEAFAGAKGWHTARQALLVEIVTDDGLSGWGEAYGPVPVCRAVIEELYAPRLVSRDAMAQAALCHELSHGAHADWAVASLSAIDVALWDLKGKALGLPIYALLGGPFRTEVRAYATGLFHRHVPDQARALAEEAAGYAAEGFRAMKLKVGFGLAEDVRNVAVVREAIGPDRLLAIDANEAYDVGSAVHLGRQLAAYDIAWFEEPIPHDDHAGYCQVRAGVPMPVAAGESERSRQGYHDLLARRAVDVLQPDIRGCGGFLDALHLGSAAAAANVALYPHMFGTVVNLFATLQLLAALPPGTPAHWPAEPLLELDRTPNALREHLAQNPVVRQEDVVQVPSGPGLGLEIDRAALARYGT
ncbi:MAG TPA: mandelate racemase/muconate lactonizing enzyme family protein [Chloroflexota bacterium]|nr:mandelate racemase/muconate lactonizing enzyme family protein [Chloroflexota bacterium]